MNVLHSINLPAYTMAVRPPLSSDHFIHRPHHPHLHHRALLRHHAHVCAHELAHARRANSSCEGVCVYQTELHVEGEDADKNLLNFMCPRTQLEHLFHTHSIRLEPSDLHRAPTPASTSPRAKGEVYARHALHCAMLSVAFSARTLGLVLIFDKRKRVVVKTQRVRG